MSDLSHHDDETPNPPRPLPPARSPSRDVSASRPASPPSAVMPKALALDPKSTLFRGTRSDSVTDISVSLIGGNGTDLMVGDESFASYSQNGVLGDLDTIRESDRISDANRPSARPTVKGLGRMKDIGANGMSPNGIGRPPPSPSVAEACAAETKVGSYTTDMSLDWEEEEDATLVREERAPSEPPSKPLASHRMSEVSRGAGGYVPAPAASDEAPTMPVPGVFFGAAEDSDGAIELSIEDISAADLEDDIDVDECPTNVPPRVLPVAASSVEASLRALPGAADSEADPKEDRSRDSLADMSGVSQLFVDAPQPQMTSQRASEDVLTEAEGSYGPAEAGVYPETAVPDVSENAMFPEAAVFPKSSSDRPAPSSDEAEAATRTGPVVREASRPVHPPPRPRPSAINSILNGPQPSMGARPSFPELRGPAKVAPKFPPAMPPIPTLRPLPEVKSPPRKPASDPPMASSATLPEAPVSSLDTRSQAVRPGYAALPPPASPPPSMSSGVASRDTSQVSPPRTSSAILPLPLPPPARSVPGQGLSVPGRAEDLVVRAAIPMAPRPMRIPSISPLEAPPRSDRIITQRTRRRAAPVGAVLGGLALAASIVIAVLSLWPRRGGLVVEVKTPDGDVVQVAEVFVDGKKQCDASPCVVSDLRPGTKLVQVMAPNHSSEGPVRASIEAGNERAIVVTLEPEAGGLAAAGQPGVHLVFDGDDQGTLPLSLDGLKPGKHSIEFVGEGYITQARDITIRAGSKLNLGDIELDVRPDGADTAEEPAESSDAKSSDAKSSIATSTKPSSAKTSSAKPSGAKSSSAKPSSAKPSSAKPSSANSSKQTDDKPAAAEPADLPPATGNGTLNINSIPVSRVLVDGQAMGETPRVNISLPAGVHTVTFVHPELGKKSVTVTIKPGQAATAAAKLRN